MSGKVRMSQTAAQAQAAARADQLGAFVAVSASAAAHADPAANAANAANAGVPFAVKDNIETSDLPTTAGTLALAASRAHVGPTQGNGLTIQHPRGVYYMHLGCKHNVQHRQPGLMMS